MIQPDRHVPVAMRLLMQRAQVVGGVVGVGAGVERLVQRAERPRVQRQVHLKAPGVDEMMLPARLRLLHPRDGGRLAVKEQALPVGVDRPGPGAHVPQARDRPAAFDLGDGAEQAGRQAVLGFRRRHGRGAERALGGEPRVRGRSR